MLFTSRKVIVTVLKYKAVYIFIFRYDLIPWDAGTDDGISYLSPNSPTQPHERIRNLTSSDHPRSPFYDPEGGPIPPVARVVIQRLNISVRFNYDAVVKFCKSLLYHINFMIFFNKT